MCGNADSGGGYSPFRLVPSRKNSCSSEMKLDYKWPEGCDKEKQKGEWSDRTNEEMKTKRTTIADPRGLEILDQSERSR